jgi:hypothetical protein
MSLAEARELVRQEAVTNLGGHCRCCGQGVKIYRRTITTSMALALIEMYRYFARNHWKPEWVHVAQLLAERPVHRSMRAAWHGGDWAKLRYWTLLDPKPGRREDGSSRVGLARVNGAGRAFVEGRISVPRYAYIYAQTLLGVAGPPISIQDALRVPFSFADLMQPVANENDEPPDASPT